MSLTINSNGSTVSSLLSSISSPTNSLSALSSTITGLTTDYNSIRNGSYSKVIKAYYTKVSDEDEETTDSTKKNSKKQTDTSNSALAKTATKATNLESDVAALAKNSLYTENGYDADKVSAGVKDFVGSYNSLMKSAINSSSYSVQSKAYKIAEAATKNETALNNIGIKVNDDYSLSLDLNKFKTASGSEVGKLFGKNAEFANSVKDYSKLVASTATSENSTYTSLGTYGSNNSSVGSIFDSIY